MKSILFIVSSLQFGGSERKTVNIVNQLVKRNIECHLLYINGPHSLLPLVDNEVKIQCLNRRFKFDIQCLCKYRKYIKQKKITNVCCVNLFPLFIHFFSLIFIANKPKIIVAINTSTEKILNLKGKIQMIIYSILLKKVDKIIFGSELQMTMWNEKYKINHFIGKVIYNGIDLKYFDINNVQVVKKEIRRKYGINQNDVVLGLIARFSPEKAHSHLIKASKKLLDAGYNIKLLFVGHGEEYHGILNLLKEFEMQDKVIILQEVIDVRPPLMAIDIFVLSSIAEIFSNSALEAMAMNRPVILSETGGAHEMVIEGVNGFTYPPGNIESLVSKIKKIIDNDLYFSMGHQGRNVVKKRFSLDKMIIEYENLFFN